jgi:hypothetical protein
MHFDWTSDWLSNNSRIVPFTEAENIASIEPWAYPNRKMFECAMLDIDGDGREEYLYRQTTWLSSHIIQGVAIMDSIADAPPCRSDISWEAVSKYTESMLNPLVKNPLEEWFVTKNNPVGSVTGDKQSDDMIASPKDRNKIIRNVGNLYSLFWNFYRTSSGVVMVSIPEFNNAPPELLVFTPARDAVRLQCIIMPVIWRKFPPKPLDDGRG